MKKKEKQSLSHESRDALTKKLDEKRKDLAKLSFDQNASKKKNTRAGRMIRKDIAIIQTYMQEKRLYPSPRLAGLQV